MYPIFPKGDAFDGLAERVGCWFMTMVKEVEKLQCSQLEKQEKAKEYLDQLIPHYCLPCDHRCPAVHAEEWTSSNKSSNKPHNYITNRYSSDRSSMRRR